MSKHTPEELDALAEMAHDDGDHARGEMLGEDAHSARKAAGHTPGPWSGQMTQDLDSGPIYTLLDASWDSCQVNGELKYYLVLDVEDVQIVGHTVTRRFPLYCARGELDRLSSVVCQMLTDQDRAALAEELGIEREEIGGG